MKQDSTNSTTTVNSLAILHVEDEDASASLLQEALDRAAIHNKTFRVSSGEDALAFLFKTGAYARARSPDLVILDLGLPRVDGWSVLSTMKRQPFLKDIPVVIFSSSQLESDNLRALHLGAHRFVVKQSVIPDLSNAIMEACASFVMPVERVLNNVL